MWLQGNTGNKSPGHASLSVVFVLLRIEMMDTSNETGCGQQEVGSHAKGLRVDRIDKVYISLGVLYIS